MQPLTLLRGLRTGENGACPRLPVPVYPAVLLALMRYEKIVAGIGLGIVCFVVVAALGCIVYEVVKAHGSLSTALADAKADLAKAEATVKSLVTAAKKAV